MGSTTTAAAAEVYVPPVDQKPPQLKLLGDGVAAVTPSGAVVMKHDVLWGSSWSDPGAVALDDTDGNITNRILSFGVGE